MMKYKPGEIIVFNEKKYYVAKVVTYEEKEYYFVFNYNSGKDYKILYIEEGIMHQIVKPDDLEKLFNIF